MSKIRVRNLKRAFGRFWAVKGISFDVREGEVFGFLGPNGAGKTTTIRMMCGILRPTSGEILIGDIDVVKNPDRAKRIIGYMSQKFSLYEELKVYENLRFFANLYRIPREVLSKRIESALVTFDLDRWKNTITYELPGGIRQRLALACSTLHDPEILFLDEPTSGVDPVARKTFWRFIREQQKKGVSIIVTTHYMEEAESCDRIALIHQGVIRAIDTPTKLKERFKREVGRAFSLPINQVESFVDQIKLLEPVRDVFPYGTSVHLIVDPKLNRGGIVRLFIDEFGEKAKGVNPIEIEPTLEDVFVGFIGTNPNERVAE